MTIEPATVASGVAVGAARRPLVPPWRFLLPWVLVFSAAGMVSGCADSDLPPGITKKAVPIGDVPEALRAAAKKAIPKVEFNEAWQNLDGQGKLHSYEIRGKQASDGKIREVRVSLTGEILESE